MSDKISYVLEVLDGYSAITKNLKKELSEIQELTKFKFNSSDFKGLAQLSKEYDKIAKSAERIKKAKTGFTLVGGGFQSASISSATLRANMAYRRSLENALVPYGNRFTRYGGSSSIAPDATALRAKMRQLKVDMAYKQSYANGLVVANSRNFIMMNGGSASGIYNPKAYSPNFNIPINSTYRRDAAGTGIVPYSRGGAVMSYGQRPMIDVTRTGRTINQDPIYNSPSQPSQPQQPSRGGGNGVSIANVAKGMGYYRAIDMAVSAPSKIHDVTVEMDSLRAGLSALIPTVKGMEKATAESEIAYLRNVSNKYGFSFSDVAPSYLKLMGTGGKTDAGLIKGLLENVGGYGGLIGMSSPALEGTMRGFQDMLSKQVLNAQEVNLQMQQMPGAKPMLHKAFKRFAEKKGVKGITDENVSARFTAAMATGKLPSADILREFVQVLNEMFGEEMIKKSFKLRNEEKRLSNAFQELGDQIGLLTYDTQIGAVRGLTQMTGKINESLFTITQSFGILDDAMKDSTMYKIVKGITKGLKDVVVDGTGELVKAPFKAANTLGTITAAGIIGDKEGISQAMKEFTNYYFGNTNAAMANNNFANDPQKIEITIKSDNNIQVQDVKSSRPSTVKAGQK